MPAGFPREFDAHIYFNIKSAKAAEALRVRAMAEFHDKKVFVGMIIPEPIGPHPTPMFEINFPKVLFTEVTLWLMHERKNLSILIHELTGDDLYDHQQAALWMGPQVPLKYEVFKS